MEGLLGKGVVSSFSSVWSQQDWGAPRPRKQAGSPLLPTGARPPSCEGQACSAGTAALVLCMCAGKSFSQCDLSPSGCLSYHPRQSWQR